MTIDFKALAASVAATSTDMTEAKAGGGGEYTPPAAGPCRVRLVGYVETGKHEKSVGVGKPKVNKEQAKLIFEVSGPNHPPVVLEDGTVLPIRVTEEFNAGINYGQLNEKSGLYKLFRRMNHRGTARHMSQLLGEGWLATLYHTVKKVGDKTFTYVSLRDADGVYSLSPPSFSHPATGVVEQIEIAPAVSALRLFVWNAAPEMLKPMWDTLFIDGSYPERKDKDGKVTAPAKSKNVLQNEIKTAGNFEGSPIWTLLKTNGVDLNLGAAQSADPLAQAGTAAPTAAVQSTATTPSTSPSATPATTSPSDGGGDPDPLAAF